MNRTTIAAAFVAMTQAAAVGAADIDVPLTGTLSGFGEQGSAFVGQTFVSPGGLAQQLTVHVGPGSGNLPFRILITELATDPFGPTRVLFESETLTKSFLPLITEPFTIDLGGLPLDSGETYAVVLDACSEFDGTLESADVGVDLDASYAGGEFFRMPPNPTQPVPCDRTLLFESHDWFVREDVDLAFTLTFGDSGEQVAIDVRPGSCSNRVNTLSRGLLPVAILGEADFDVRTIDLTSVRLEGVPSVRSRFADIVSSSAPAHPQHPDCLRPGRDGFEDLLVYFPIQAVMAALGPAIEDGDVRPVTLTGRLLEEFGGNSFVGQDSILIRKPRGKSARPRS